GLGINRPRRSGRSAMKPLDWQPLPGVDREALRVARLEVHYAVQSLARVARAYIAPRPDDSHTNLGWDDALGGFTTHPLPDGSRLGLDVAGLRLVWLDGGLGVRSQTLALDGRREPDIREWLGDTVSAKGLDAEALDAPSPYEIPPHAIGEGAAYGIVALGAAL